MNKIRKIELKIEELQKEQKRLVLEEEEKERALEFQTFRKEIKNAHELYY